MSEKVATLSRQEPRKGLSLFPSSSKRLAEAEKKVTREARKVKRAELERRPMRPPARGWTGRGRGQSTYVQQADEWRGTTVQVCGLWPYAIGTGTPMVGVPLGRHLFTGATVCADPISWFQRAKLISNPSCFVLGLPGLGKSTTIRRMITGSAAFGTLPMVLGDLKPDYVDLIEALGGQVIRLGRGRGHLNILDPGEVREVAAKLREAGNVKEAEALEADAHGRRLTMVSALVTIIRKQQPSDVEESIVDAALRVLDRTITDRAPILADLLAVVQQGPDELREVAVDRGDWAEYQRITRGLEASLISLTRGGRLGETFSRPTTNPMRRDRAVVYDISGLSETDTDLRAATLLACWSNGFATVNAAQALAEAGIEPQRHYFVIMDELWQALRSGAGMVDRIDALTRLNRQFGVGTAMITHTMHDLEGLPEEERAKARGFVERAGMLVCGGLPQAEMPLLTAAVPFSRAEQQLLTGWSAPPSWDSARGQESEPPGRGRFLVKVGGRPGIPLRVQLTEVEKPVNETSKRWAEQSRVGRRARQEAAGQAEESTV